MFSTLSYFIVRPLYRRFPSQACNIMSLELVLDMSMSLTTLFLLILEIDLVLRVLTRAINFVYSLTTPNNGKF